MRSTLLRSMLFCVVVICSSLATLVAQTQITTGVIQGVVVDSSGAVLPGVEVTTVNAETNLTQSRTTDAEGRFVFLQLPPGRYKATFRLSGFGTIVREGIDLTVGQAVSLNPRLSVGNVSEVVTVTGTPVVETARAAGVDAHLIEDETAIEERWFTGARAAGLTAGASAPEHLVRRVCDSFRTHGVEVVGEEGPSTEDVAFRLPTQVRRIVPAA